MSSHHLPAMSSDVSVPVNNGEEEPGSSSQNRRALDEESELSQAFQALSIQDRSDGDGPRTQDENFPSLPGQQRLNYRTSDLGKWSEEEDTDSEQDEKRPSTAIDSEQDKKQESMHEEQKRKEIIDKQRDHLLRLKFLYLKFLRLKFLRFQMHNSLGVLSDKAFEIMDHGREMDLFDVRLATCITQLHNHWMECSALMCEEVNFQCCETIWEITEYCAVELKYRWSIVANLLMAFPGEIDKFVEKFDERYSQNPSPEFIERQISFCQEMTDSHRQQLSVFESRWEAPGFHVTSIKRHLEIMKIRMKGRDDMQKGSFSKIKESLEQAIEKPSSGYPEIMYWGLG